LPGAITDEQLVLEQQGLGGDGADATGAEELREGDQQVDGKDENFSHRANRTITAGARKTARRVRVASHCEFATDTVAAPMLKPVGVPGGGAALPPSDFGSLLGLQRSSADDSS
jgi:hypothetical protein